MYSRLYTTIYQYSDIYKYNVSVNNTTVYFIYNKNSILSGRHVSTFIRSSSGTLGKQIQALSIFQCIVGSQVLTTKSYAYFNALWDPKCLQPRAILWDPKCLQPRAMHISMHCGIPNAYNQELCIFQCIVGSQMLTICKNLGSHSALKYR